MINMAVMTTTEVKWLITEAQAGSMEAMDDLIGYIMAEKAKSVMYKWDRKNTVSGMDKEDIRQIFLIGCYNAIAGADVQIGDPLNYILKKGVWAVQDALRSNYRKDLRQYCNHCNTETRVNSVGGQSECPKCGARGTGIEVIQVNKLDDGTVADLVEDEALRLDAVVASEQLVAEFKSRLSGKKLEVYELIVEQGYDRESCTNYIAEVAAVMGVSKANINLRLRAIKEEWAKYMEELAV